MNANQGDSEAVKAAKWANIVTCPMCRRKVELDHLGTALDGSRVMAWHYNGRTECYGSLRSVECVLRQIEEELE
jgi:hypothetical protein